MRKAADEAAFFREGICKVQLTFKMGVVLIRMEDAGGWGWRTLQGL